MPDTEPELLRRLLDESGEAISVIDPDTGQFVHVNDPACDLLGYDREELLDRSVPDINPDLADPADWAAHVDRLRERGRTYYEGEHRRADGTTIPVEISTNLVAVDGTEYVIGVERDITHRKEQQRELERKNERLEEFATVVSHDLRNPLNVAEARLELAREECDSEHLAHVAQAHERMKTLIEDLLVLARQGHDDLDCQPVSLADVVENCWVTVETPAAELVLETSATIRADRSRLQQLLENLIRNAVEHGGEDVTVTVGDLDAGFYVADDGPGIALEDREQIFESGYTTTDGGTGFGLRIVREIADAHDWSVSVTSSDQGGARFEVTGVEVV